MYGGYKVWYGNEKIPAWNLKWGWQDHDCETCKTQSHGFVIITFSVASNSGYLIAKKVVKNGHFSLNFEMYFDPFCRSDAKTRVDLFIFHALHSEWERLKVMFETNLDSLLNFLYFFFIHK